MKRVSEGNNPHVVKMVGCVATMLPLALLLEYVPHGNLREFLKHCKSMNQVGGWCWSCTTVFPMGSVWTGLTYLITTDTLAIVGAL